MTQRSHSCSLQIARSSAEQMRFAGRASRCSFRPANPLGFRRPRGGDPPGNLRDAVMLYE